MSSLAVILVLISALLHALKSFFTKQSIDKQVFLWCYTTCGLVVYLPIFLYYAQNQPLPVADILIWCSITSIIHLFYNIFFSKAYELGDLSLVYPIMRASPAVTLAMAIVLLGEEVSLRGFSGIVFVIAGVYALNIKKAKLSHFLKPIRALFTDKAQKYALLTMLTVAGYSIVDKVGAQKMHPFIFSYLLSLFTVVLFTCYLLPRKSIPQIKNEWTHNKRTIIINSIISQGGYVLIIIAFTFEKVSYVAGLRQLSIVFAVLLGNHFLKEEGRLIRFISASIIFIGSYLIATA